MIVNRRKVNVQHIPQHVTANSQSIMLQYLQKKCAEVERPLLVLDCSLVRGIDTNTIQLLLSCLEEVMKCNGDVRLASLSYDAEESLRLSGVGRLFETYPTTEAAVQSFQKRSSSMAPLEIEVGDLDLNSGLAA